MTIPHFPEGEYTPQCLTEEDFSALVPATEAVKGVLLAVLVAELRSFGLDVHKKKSEEQLSLIRHFAEYIQFSLWEFADRLAIRLKEKP